MNLHTEYKFSRLEFMKISTYKYIRVCVYISLLLLICYHLADFTSRHLILGNTGKSKEGFISKKMQPALFKATNKWE